jgi:5'(3')-deoxyribonucleotidase
MKKVIYIDMDGVLVDLQTELDKYGWYQNIFRDLLPMEGAVESFNYLCDSDKYDVYILSTAPWNMPFAWQHKRLWVSKYLGKNAYKRLILSNHKNLCHGDYLIDDRTANGAGEFNGELILFGTDKHPNWKSVLEYLKLKNE